MAVSLKHIFVSNVADSPDATLVQPSNWNDEHTLTANTSSFLGTTANSTSVVEIAYTNAGLELLQDADAATQRTTLGLGTGDSPEFAGVNIGNASDTTITRVSAGVLAVEGNQVPSPGSVAQGDILYYNGTVWARLGAGTSGQFLKTNGAGANPAWGTVTGEYYSQNTEPTSANNTAVWYNGSANNIYMYANSQWWSIGDGGIGVNTNRGIWGGFGDFSTVTSMMQYIVISTSGNSSAFGSLSVARSGAYGCSDGGRGLFGGGATTVSQTSASNVIDYFSISIGGGAFDFGDLTAARNGASSCSNGTRGIWAGGYTASSGVNVIDYVTIATTANAVDFGDISAIKAWTASCSNGTRGLIAGGGNQSSPGSSGGTNVIDYVTIGTTGNSTDFGDLSSLRGAIGSCSNGTRGVFGGGANSPTNVIEYVTITTTGNTTDFGDLTVARLAAGSCSNGTRGVWAGGSTLNIDSAAYASNVIDYVTIATTGNAADFGDLLSKQNIAVGALSGFYGA